MIVPSDFETLDPAPKSLLLVVMLFKEAWFLVKFGCFNLEPKNHESSGLMHYLCQPTVSIW